MKCQCGGPMREIIVTLDDVWRCCIICGRQKRDDTSSTLPQPAPQHWAKEILAGYKPHLFVIARNHGKRRTLMSKNLSDLNTKLHEQLDRLCTPDLTGEQLQAEIQRTRAVSDIARGIVDNAKLVLEAQRCLGGKKGNPELLGLAE